MPKFTFTGSVPLYYTSTGLFAEPGKSYELDSAPDSRWKAEGGSTASAAVPAAEPEPDTLKAAEAVLAAHPELAAEVLKEAAPNA